MIVRILDWLAALQRILAPPVPVPIPVRVLRR